MKLFNYPCSTNGRLVEQPAAMKGSFFYLVKMSSTPSSVDYINLGCVRDIIQLIK